MTEPRPVEEIAREIVSVCPHVTGSPQQYEPRWACVDCIAVALAIERARANDLAIQMAGLRNDMAVLTVGLRQANAGCDQLRASWEHERTAREAAEQERPVRPDQSTRRDAVSAEHCPGCRNYVVTAGEGTGVISGHGPCPGLPPEATIEELSGSVDGDLLPTAAELSGEPTRRPTEREPRHD